MGLIDSKCSRKSLRKLNDLLQRKWVIVYCQNGPLLISSVMSCTEERSPYKCVLLVIKSGEVVYTSQCRTHTKSTRIPHSIDIHMFIMFESTKTWIDQSMGQEIEVHILGLSWHTHCLCDSDDCTELRDQHTGPGVLNIVTISYIDGHRARPRMFHNNLTAYRATGHSPLKPTFHSLSLISLLG